jgi:dihydrofolate reductase
MMQCSVYIAVSLDGFIARSDGRVDWLSVVGRPGEDYGYRKFYETVDTLIIGRKTYEMALGFEAWPYIGKRCIVLTHHPILARHQEEFWNGEPASLVLRLSESGVKRAYVDGGAVIQQFLAAGLITDLTLSFVPILLGAGVPLFGKTGGDVALELRASRSFESGLVQSEYAITK